MFKNNKKGAVQIALAVIGFASVFAIFILPIIVLTLARQNVYLTINMNYDYSVIDLIMMSLLKSKYPSSGQAKIITPECYYTDYNMRTNCDKETYFIAIEKDIYSLLSEWNIAGFSSNRPGYRYYDSIKNNPVKIPEILKERLDMATLNSDYRLKMQNGTIIIEKGSDFSQINKVNYFILNASEMVEGFILEVKE